MKSESKVVSVLKLILVYAVLYLISTAVFILLFHTPLFKGMTVLMYRGTVLLILSGILASVLMVIVKRVTHSKMIDVKDVILVFIGVCCVNMALFILIPVTVERSVSVFMLSYMDENDDQTFTQEDISEIFTDKYVNEYGAFEKRFDEQLVTGTIEENEDGTYSITDGGKTIVNMFRLVSKLFDTDQRLVYPNEN